MRRSLPSLVIAGLAAPALASAATLPLNRGVYVMADTPCADPPFAAMQMWDGVGLADPHSHDCRVKVLSRHGNRFAIANDCIDAGVGPAPRSIERLTLTIRSPDSFAITGSRFRRCPALKLPARS